VKTANEFHRPEWSAPARDGVAESAERLARVTRVRSRGVSKMRWGGKKGWIERVSYVRYPKEPRQPPASGDTQLY
jgi:hypothetical protein